MSAFKVEVIRVGTVTKHPSADTLSIMKFLEFPIIFRTTDFKEGDVAVYVPIDSVVPESDSRWDFLRDKTGKFHGRIKAKSLRGIYSRGLLSPADPSWSVGEDVTKLLGLKHYEPPEDIVMGGENESSPGWFAVYTDIESVRRYPNVFQIGEPVVIREKIHGANGRAAWHEGRLWVGSHKNVKADRRTIWWGVAEQYGLEEKLRRFPGVEFFFEVYGQVQSLKYGLAGRLGLVLFDALDVSTRKYFDDKDFLRMVGELGLPMVPTLYEGEWRGLEAHKALADGKSLISGAENIREGFVVKPKRERSILELDRVILKLHGEEFTLEF